MSSSNRDTAPMQQPQRKR